MGAEINRYDLYIKSLKFLSLQAFNQNITQILMKKHFYLLLAVLAGFFSAKASPGDTTWVPSGVPHCFLNRGAGQLRILWVYGGRDVTRTICATGETFEHLSARDRGAVRA